MVMNMYSMYMSVYGSLEWVLVLSTGGGGGLWLLWFLLEVADPVSEW